MKPDSYTVLKPFRTNLKDMPKVGGLKEKDGWVNMQVQFLIDQKTANSDKLLVGWTVLPPGAQHDRHRHFNCDEFWIVVKGHGVMYTDDGERPSVEGDVVFTPRGHWHGFRNTSSEDVVLVWGWSGAGSLEAEIAVHMRTDLAGGVDRDAAKAAIAGVGPAIELADVDFAPDDVEAILSGNIYQRHVILSACDPSRAGCVLDGLTARISRDGAEVARTSDPQAATGELVDIVRHVAGVLRAFGHTLRAGAVIITGSITPPMWIESDREIRFTLEPIGSIDVRFTGRIT